MASTKKNPMASGQQGVRSYKPNPTSAAGSSRLTKLKNMNKASAKKIAAKKRTTGKKSTGSNPGGDMPEATTPAWIGTPVYKASVTPTIMLVETWALTSFAGDYGAGKTVQTYSLLPGEKTKISIKTWKTSEVTSKQASTIVDSVNRESSDSFEQNLSTEHTDKQSIAEASSWHAEASASAGGGMGAWSASVNVSGGATGSANSARESAGKNTSNATNKQVAAAASKRSVDVSTSLESKTTTGEETVITREIENINVSRVLNFVFRQLNQEYHTYLHLVDVKIAFSNRLPKDVMVSGKKHKNNNFYVEYPITDLESFLGKYIIDPESQDIVRQKIIGELTTILDFRKQLKSALEFVQITSGADGAVTITTLPEATAAATYLNASSAAARASRTLYPRFRTQPTYTPANAPTGVNIHKDEYWKRNLEGILLRLDTHVLPTESVIVEALLGQAEALDRYSMDTRQANIDLKRSEVDKARLSNDLIKNMDTEQAQVDAYAKVYPAPTVVQP